MQNKNKKNRFYKITVDIIADEVFSSNRAKYLALFSSTTRAKAEIKKIIDKTFEIIEQSILEDRVVEIWGFAKFSLEYHRRFKTKYPKCNFGFTLKRKLKEQEKIKLEQKLFNLVFKLNELEMLENKDKNKKEIEELKKEIEELKENIKLKGVSLNPKYHKKDDDES